ncbi:hypothetical protein D3C76_1725310 [compost metagenome]
MNNSTLDKNSFKDIVKDMKKELSKSEWKLLNLEKSKYWSGNWSLTDEGDVKFKFSKKDIEPDWIKDNDISSMVILN